MLYRPPAPAHHQLAEDESDQIYLQRERRGREMVYKVGEVHGNVNYPLTNVIQSKEASSEDIVPIRILTIDPPKRGRVGGVVK